jgi:hypothetical protein
MFRSHIGRPIDLSLRSNQLIAALTLLVAVAGVVLWWSGESSDAWLAPIHTFIFWALVRELDPDRHWTALLAAALAGVWVLLGYEMVGAFALGGLLLAGRLVLNPVGLRPLNTDLAAMAIAATVVSFTPAGWVAGSGIAVALYIDARFAGETRRAPLFAAVGAALGASVLATVTDALPQNIPAVNPLIVSVLGLMALVIVIRDPLPVLSTVDHSTEKLMDTGRLHATRVLVVVLVFIASVLAGESATALIPIVITIALVLISEEVKRVRHPTL